MPANRYERCQPTGALIAPIMQTAAAAAVLLGTRTLLTRHCNLQLLYNDHQATVHEAAHQRRCKAACALLQIHSFAAHQVGPNPQAHCLSCHATPHALPWSETDHQVGPMPRQTVLRSWNSASPYLLCSRPIPLCFTPPKGATCSRVGGVGW